MYTTGTAKEILRIRFSKLADIISTNYTRVIDALYAKGLITEEAKEHILTINGATDYYKASRLMSIIERCLKSSLVPENYLIDICHVLIKQKHQTLTIIACAILHQLGKHK